MSADKSDQIEPVEALQWNTYRLAQAFVVREALETCSIILRSVDGIVKELGYGKGDPDLLAPAWNLVDLGRRISDREMGSWIASATGSADRGAQGVDVSGLLRHVQHASWDLFDEEVTKYITEARKSVASVWLGEPVMRAIARIVEASRSNATIDNQRENVAQGAHSEKTGDVWTQIVERIRGACAVPWPDEEKPQ